MPLRLEARPAHGSDWRTLAVLQPGDWPCSVSCKPPRGGQETVYLFSCHGSYSVITRSTVDASAAQCDFAELATLGTGESCVMNVRPRGLPVTVRWTHE